MRRLLRPVTSRTTWARVLHLALGLWFAVACALVWPGLPDASPRALAGLFLAPLPLLVVLACVPVVRRSEGVQARALLLPGDDEVTVEPSRTWSERGRLLLWLCVRVELGVLAGQATGAATVTVASLLRPGTDLPGWAAVPAAAVVVLAAGYVLAGLGGLAAATARRLLHPSPAERLRAEQVRTERLLERTRLAAELHDSIGHALTVTLLQAGAARETAGRDPAVLDAALTAVEDSARQAAADLDRVLALLRDGAPPRDPPTLADVDRLVRAARAAGAPVDLRVEGPVADLPPLVSREAYRMAQEALTNALRHAGPVPIALHVGVRADALELDVRNPVPVPAPAPPGGGSGVAGLRERAAVLGGTASAGPVDGGWQVAVRLPLARAA
ncbi:sensor histidine kinase [Geodermatophilus sp. URMC 62]|uniref:sensor histidine kinase n=1 Tax=Geodermatophilus sp. URMC 62 TaxID=3423414 RepID=UPI00406CF863